MALEHATLLKGKRDVYSYGQHNVMTKVVTAILQNTEPFWTIETRAHLNPWR